LGRRGHKHGGMLTSLLVSHTEVSKTAILAV
jgi:hypothetical protein